MLQELLEKSVKEVEALHKEKEAEGSKKRFTVRVIGNICCKSTIFLFKLILFFC